MKRLIDIQKELKAPKWQYNSFWKYKYRSCEDIIEAVKPFLSQYKVVLLMNDEIVEFNNDISYKSDSTKDWKTTHVEYVWPRYYVRATAELYWEDGKLIAKTVAYAREEQEKSWMDGAQVTGSASSYARKYALNWLFAIDDWIDSDSTNKWEEKKEESDKKWISKEQVLSLKDKSEWVSKFATAEDMINKLRETYLISKDNAKALENIWKIHNGKNWTTNG